MITPGEWTAQNVNGVFFLDDQHGWLERTLDDAKTGKATAEVLKTDDGGVTWKSSTLPELENVEGTAASTSLDFVDENHGWVLIPQTTGANFSVAHLFSTTDGGDTWQALEAPINGRIQFVNRDMGWITGGTVGGDLFMTNDGGRTWKSSSVQNPPKYDDAQVSFGSPTVEGESVVLPVTFGGASEGGTSGFGLYISDDGRSWDLLATSPSNQQLEAGTLMPYTSVPEGSALGVGADTNGSSLVFFDEDGSASMVTPEGLLPADQAGVQEMFFVSDQSGWIVQQAAGCESYKEDCWEMSGLFITSDGGRNWMRSEIP